MTDYSITPSALVEHILTREGCHIHYWLGGWLGGDPDSPLLVLMHGATMDHRMFNDQVEALISQYRLLLWDARGHGKSTPGGDEFTFDMIAKDMLAILDELAVDEFIAVGQSFGAYIAQYLYLIAPHRVKAMVIIGSTPIAKAYSALEIWTLKLTLPLFQIWPYANFTKTVAKNVAIDPAVQAYALQAIHQIPREEFLKIWKTVAMAIDTQGKPDFRINVPLLLVHGDQDKTGTIRRDMPEWAQNNPKAEYHVIPDAGHNANQDNAKVVNELLLAFLSKHVGQSARELCSNKSGKFPNIPIVIANGSPIR